MNVFKPNLLVLYVSNISISTDFYTNILRRQPVEQYAEFSVFQLNEHMLLGLQTIQGIEPSPNGQCGGFEICLSDVSIDEVKAIYQQWLLLKVPILLKPTYLEFGYTFVGLDPDNNRLRVCATDTTNIQ